MAINQISHKIIGTNTQGNNVRQGYRNVLSRDGKTLAQGGFENNDGKGGVWVYEVSEKGATQQGEKLYPSDAIRNARFGYSQALSADGSTLIVGAPWDNGLKGACWIFTRSGSTWSQQAKLVQAHSSNQHQQGFAVSISDDGNTVACGAPETDSWKGYVYVYTRSGTTWTKQGNALTPTDGEGKPAFGNALSFSADGNTLAIAGNQDNSNTGAVWIFTRESGVWKQQGNKIVAPDSKRDSQGYGLSLSGDGNTLAVGGNCAPGNVSKEGLIGAVCTDCASIAVELGV